MFVRPLRPNQFAAAILPKPRRWVSIYLWQPGLSPSAPWRPGKSSGAPPRSSSDAGDAASDPAPANCRSPRLPVVIADVRFVLSKPPCVSAWRLKGSGVLLCSLREHSKNFVLRVKSRNLQEICHGQGPGCKAQPIFLANYGNRANNRTSLVPDAAGVGTGGVKQKS